MSQQFPPQNSGNLSPYPQQQPTPPPGQYPQQPMQQQYPQQPPPGYYQPQGPYMPQQPLKKSRKGLWIALAIGVVVVIAFCAIAGMAANGASKTAVTTSAATNANTTSSTSSQSSSNSSANHQPGELVNVDDTWDVTINKVSTSTGDGSLNVPKSGNVFLLVDVTEKNISSDQQNASGIVQYTLRGLDGTKYDQQITMGTDPGGAVSAGQTIKGQLVYEVPKSVRQFTLAFQSDLGSTQVMWDISKK